MDEKKTYLVNVESNLKEYAEQAAEAKKKVDELTVANIKLQASDTATAAEKEAGLAALKNANDEYRKAASLVKTQIAANTSEVGSRKQLGEQLKLQMQALGKLGNAYITNAKGQKELNPLYIEQRKRIAETKQAILDYDKALNDGRSNVGRYSESIKSALGDMQMMPGAAGQAAGAVQRLGLAFKALLVNPIVLLIAGIVAVLGLLGKAFKNSQPLMDAFHKTAAAVGATFKVLLDRVSNFTEFLGSIFNKELRDARAEAKALNDELLGIDETMTRQEKRKIRRESRKGIIEEIREEAKAAYDLTKAEQVLEDKEIAFIQRRAEMKRSIEELFASTKNENLSNTERIANLDKAIALTKEMTKIEVDFAKERARISQERVDQGNSTREELRANEEAQAAATEAEAQGFKEIKRLGSERFSLLNKINSEELNLKKKKRDQDIAADKEAQAFIDKELIRMDKEAEDKWNKAVEFQRKLFEANRKAGQEEYDARIEQEKALAEAELEIQQSLSDSKIRLAYSVGNILNSIAGQNKSLKTAALLADSAIAIAEVIIQTTKANATIRALAAASVIPGPGYLARLGASMLAATIPINLNRASAAIDIAAIIAAAALKMKSAPQSAPSGSAAPTSIVSSVPAMRTFATPTGSTIFTQPQLSQSQLNNLPNQNMLSATDIIRALKAMPAPVVTVEDINARLKQVNKVTVRGNI